MSSYQFYEWQTLDRSLTPQEQAEVGKLSSHIHVNAAGAWVEYSWSSFGHDAADVLARYFDAFLYMANWGDRRVMFRFPSALLDVARLEPYFHKWFVEWKAIGDSIILDLCLRETELYDWVEGSGWLARLAHLRDDILTGDLRALYLTWLALVKHGMADDDELEPPVPAGLGSLSPGLSTLAELFDLDLHLLAAAADASHALPTPVTTDDLTLALAQLSRTECEDYLRRFLLGERQAILALRQHLLDLTGAPRLLISPSQRTAGDLRARAGEFVAAEKLRRQQAAEQQRRDFLIAQMPHQQEIWQEVDACIQKKQARFYEEAVQKLKDLRDMAAMQDAATEFQQKLNALHDQFQRRHSFIELLDKSGLVRDT